MGEEKIRWAWLPLILSLICFACFFAVKLSSLSDSDSWDRTVEGISFITIITSYVWLPLIIIFSINRLVVMYKQKDSRKLVWWINIVISLLLTGMFIYVIILLDQGRFTM